MAWMLAYCAGVTISLVSFSALPPEPTPLCWVAGVIVLLALIMLCGNRVNPVIIKHLAVWLSGCLVGAFWASVQANKAINQTISEDVDRYDYQITGVIVGSVQQAIVPRPYGGDLTQHRLRFLFEIKSIVPLFDCTSEQAAKACAVNPVRIWLTLYDEVALASGEQWTFNARLRSYRPPGNPAAFDSARHALSQHISGFGYVRDFANTAKKNSKQPKNNFYHGLHTSIRTERIARLQPIWPALTHGDLLQALTLGERAALNLQTKKLLNATGTSHLMAISGLHIGVAAGFGFLFGRLVYAVLPVVFLIVPRFYFAAICACSSGLFYACLAGFTLSTQRALTMILTAILVKSLHRHCGSAQLLVLAGFVLLLIDPIAALANGFWLSFGAVVILLLSGSTSTTPRHDKTLSPLLRWLYELFSAQKGIFFAMPVIASAIGMSSSLIAPIANFVAIPLFSLAVIPLSLIALLVSYINIELTLWLLKFPDLLIKHLLYLLHLLVTHWPVSATFQSNLNVAERLLAAAVAIILLGRYRLPGYTMALFVWCLLIVPGFNKHKFLSPVLDYGEFVLTQIDVGQGTALLVTTQQHTLLYDTGASHSSGFSMAEATIMPLFNHYGIRKIDTLIVSHGDNDHAGGMHNLLQNIHVERLLYGSGVSQLPDHARPCIAGDSWQVDGVTFRFLHPREANRVRNSNDASCVLQVSTNTGVDTKNHVLIAGDISRHVERDLLDHHMQIKSSLLIAAHHGSNSSSSALFIDAVNPDYALVSNGFNNRYGHPHRNVIQRFASEQIPLLRSDALGAIQFIYQDNQLSGPFCFRYKARHFWQSDNNQHLCSGQLLPRL